MASAKTPFTTPVGRLVSGSIYRGRDKNAEGAPLVYKTGADAGKPRLEFYAGLAIPKGAEQHWSATPWGALIWAAGHAGQATAGSNPKFAWKVIDGDSQIPNSKNNRPCDREGWPGNWVLQFSSSYAPTVYNRDGTAKIVEPDHVKLGYYVQIAGDVGFNNSPQQPGVYLNASMVALSAFGEEIYVGQDASAAGFGAAPLPAGAMATPPAGFVAPVPVAVAPPQPTMPPVVPNAQFTAVPPAPAAIVPPPVPPAAPVRQMTAAAAGATYEAMIAAGWNDALLVQHGMMTA